LNKTFRNLFIAVVCIYSVIWLFNTFVDLDKVFFYGRQYNRSTLTVMSWQELRDKKYGEVIPSWSYGLGLPIYVSKSSKNFPNAPTVIFKKKLGNRYVVYSLSGGT
jgi:hypothetical protein